MGEEDSLERSVERGRSVNEQVYKRNGKRQSTITRRAYDQIEAFGGKRAPYISYITTMHSPHTHKTTRTPIAMAIYPSQV